MGPAAARRRLEDDPTDLREVDLGPSMGVMSAHNVLLALGIPRTPGVTDRHPGGDPQRPGHRREHRGELLAIAGADVEQEVLDAGNVVTPGDVEVVAEVRRTPQEVLQHPGPLVVAGSARGDLFGESGDPCRPAVAGRARLARSADRRQLRVLRQELAAQVGRRCGPEHQRLVVGDLTLDRVGEPLLGEFLGVALVYQRAGGNLVFEVDSSVVEHPAQFVGGRQEDVVLAAGTLGHGLDQPPAVEHRRVGGSRELTTSPIEVRGALPLVAVESGQGHQAPIVALLGGDPHREDLLVALLDQ